MELKENPKWTIGTVNWKSYDFLNYQLKYFHEFNKDFEFIICDNQGQENKPEIIQIKKEYPSTIVICPQWIGSGWGAHGLGLNQCMKRAKGKYFLAIDPDFFWMKKQILPFLEDYFQQGYHAVGTEYCGTSFPMPWGAAYITEEIQDLNLVAKSSLCERCNDWVYDRDYDTGWQLRVRLNNKPAYAFRQALNKIPNLGKFNTGYSQTFVHDEKVIAHHLKGGSQIEFELSPEELQSIRNNYLEWMLTQLYD